VERLVCGNCNFGIYNRATNAQKHHRLGHSIVAHCGSIFCKETFAEKEDLEKHVDLNLVITSQPEDNGYLKYFVQQ
jgi:hypothetical protein